MIGAIEDGMLARIRAASEADVLGYRYRTLKTYATDFDDAVEAEAAKDQWPACWIVFGSWPTPTELGRGTWEFAPTFSVVVGARNFRNEAATRRGAPDGAVGSYQLVTDVIALLQGQRLGLDIGPLKPGACASLFNPQLAKQQISLFRVDFTTTFHTTPPAPGEEEEGDVQDFLTFHANWDVPPIGNVGASGIPDDANADATDHVQLPGPTP